MSWPALRRHSTDMVSLVSGVIFLGVVGTWALERLDVLSGIRGWLLPLLLIVVGVIGLIGLRPRRPEPTAEPAAGPADLPSTTGEPTGDDETTEA